MSGPEWKAKIYKDSGRWWWEVTGISGGIIAFGTCSTWQSALDAAISKLWSLHEWEDYKELYYEGKVTNGTNS